MTAKLKPCPVCNRAPVCTDAERRKAPDLRTFSFRCECGSRPVDALSHEEAASMWNGAVETLERMFPSKGAEQQ